MATYLLKVEADPSGLAVLAKEFHDLEQTIAQTATRAQEAIAKVGRGGGGSGGSVELQQMRSQLEQVTGAVRTLGVEQENLARQVEESSARSQKATWSYLDVVKRSFEQEVALVTKSTDEMVRLRVQRGTENVKAALAEAQAEQQATQLVLNADIAASARRKQIQESRDMEMLRAREAAVARERAIEEQRDTDLFRMRSEEASRMQAMQETRDMELFRAREASIARERALEEQRDMELFRLREQEAIRSKEIEQARDTEIYRMRAAEAAKVQALEEARDTELYQMRQAAAKREMESESRSVDFMIAERRRLVREYERDQEAILAVINAEIAANVRAREAATGHRAVAEAVGDVRSVARGAASELGVLWATYGQSIPLLVGAFAVTAAIKESITAAANFDYAMTMVGAVSRREGESMAGAMERMKGISAQVLDISKNSMFSPTEAADGMRQLAQAGLSAEESLKTLPAVLNLAAIGEESVGQAAYSTVTIMEAFHKTSDQTGEVVDELAKAAAMSTTSVKGISESMKQASTVGEMYNVSLEDTLAGLTLLADRGIRNTSAGTAWRQMVQSLYAPTEKQAKTLEHLGISAYDADHNMRPLQAVLGDLRTKLEGFDRQSQVGFMKDLTDERSLKAVSALLDSFGRFGTTVDTLKNKTKGFASEATAALNETTKGEWKQAMNAMEVAFIKAGEAASGPLHDAVVGLKNLFNSPEFTEGVGALLKAFTDVVGFIGKHGGEIATFIEMLLFYKAGKFALNTAVEGVKALGAAFKEVGSVTETMASRGGLMTLAFFGGYEFGGWLSKFEAVKEAAMDVFSPLFLVMAETQKFLERKPDTTRMVYDASLPQTDALGNAYSMGGFRAETPSEAAARRRTEAEQRAVEAEQRASEVRNFRQAENASSGGYMSTHTPPSGMASGTKHDVARETKEAQQAADIAIAAENARYQRQQALAKASYDAQLSMLRAYHSAGMLDDQTFNTRETALSASYDDAAEEGLRKHIAELLAQKKVFSNNSREAEKIDAQVAKAQDDLVIMSLQHQARAVADAAKEWSKLNETNKSTIDQAQKSNTELKNEIEALKAHTVSKKDSTLASLDARITISQETEARLENETALIDTTKVLTAEQIAKLAEVETLKQAIKTMQAERSERKAMLIERKQLEGDWINGAMKGLEDYQDKSLTTAKVMENAFKNAFTSLEGVIFNFVIHGKASIKDFLNSVGQDILKMLIKLEITQPLAQVIQGWLSGAGVGGAGGFIGAIISMLGGSGGGGESGAAGSVGGVGNAVSTLGTIGSFAQGAYTGTGTGIAGSAGAYLSSAYHGVASGVSNYLYGQSGAVITDAYGAEATTVGQTSGILGTAGSPYGAWATATPYAWILAAIIKSNALYNGGWGHKGDDEGVNSLGVVKGTPIWSPAAGMVNIVNGILKGIGVNDKWASILSGKPGIARLFGHSATQADAYGLMGSVNGDAISGENYQDFSQKGGFFRNDIRWTDKAPLEQNQSDFLTGMMTGANRVTGSIGNYLGIDSKQELSGYHRDFQIQMSDNGKPLSQDDLNKAIGDFFGTVLQEQTTQLFHAGGDTAMEEYVKGLKGTGDDITNEIVGIATAAENIKGMNLKGLNLDALLAWKQGNESLSDTYKRVSSQLSDFDNNFMSDAEKLTKGKDTLTSGFGELGIAIPKSKEDFYKLVHSIDTGTEAGRHMFDMLMLLAPVFDAVGSATDQLASKAKASVDAFNSAASRLSQHYGQSYAQANLNSAVGRWMALDPANGEAGGWSVASTIANIGSIAQGGSGGFEAALAYAQSLGGDAVDIMTGMLTSYADWQDAMNQNTGAVSDNTSAMAEYGQAVAEARKSLEDWAKSKLLDTSSPLTPAEKLNVALSDYDKAKAAASADPTKLGDFQSASDALLQQGHDYWASSDEYTALFNRVMQDAQQLGGFTLDYHSNIAAASTDQMRQDLLTQMQLAYTQTEAMRTDIQALQTAIESANNAAVAAILESAADMKTAIVNAISSTSRA